jgi:hypothetical protein
MLLSELATPSSAVGSIVTRTGHHPASNGWANTRTRSRGHGMIGAKHANTGTKLGSTKRDHVLTDMSSDHFAMLRVGMSEDVLDEVIAILVTGNIDQRDPRTVMSAFADTIEVPAKKFGTSDLQAFLDNLRCELIHAVLGSVSDDMIDSTASVSRSAMLTDVLDAPVSELAMRNDVNVLQNLLNAGTL